MLIINGSMVRSVATDPKLFECIIEGFKGQISAPRRAHHALPGGNTLLTMPAWKGREAIGVKLITAMPENPLRGLPSINGAYVLLNGQTGAIAAILEADALTQVRTAAVSVISVSNLARTDARRLLIVGTGAVARALICAHSASKALDQIAIWGRDPERARALAKDFEGTENEVIVAHSLQDALQKADIVCCATSSVAPIVRGDDVVPGTHIDLIGSFTSTMREADDDLIKKARVFVDTHDAFDESGDLSQPLAHGHIDRSAPDLAALLMGSASGRLSTSDITVFKSVGTAIADLAAAAFIAGNYGWVP